MFIIVSSLLDLNIQLTLLILYFLKFFSLGFDSVQLLFCIFCQVFTAVAFSLFASESVDIAVIEVDYVSL